MKNLMSKIANSKAGKVASALAGIGTVATPITYEMLNPPAIYAQEKSNISNVKELSDYIEKNGVKGTLTYNGKMFEVHKLKRGSTEYVSSKDFILIKELGEKFSTYFMDNEKDGNVEKIIYVSGKINPLEEDMSCEMECFSSESGLDSDLKHADMEKDMAKAFGETTPYHERIIFLKKGDQVISYDMGKETKSKSKTLTSEEMDEMYNKLVNISIKSFKK